MDIWWLYYLEHPEGSGIEVTYCHKKYNPEQFLQFYRENVGRLPKISAAFSKNSKLGDYFKDYKKISESVEAIYKGNRNMQAEKKSKGLEKTDWDEF